jgi:hypothetical protein
MLLLALCAAGQETPVPVRPEPPAGQQPELPPEQPPEQESEYKGPAILSRGQMPSVRASEEFARIRPFVSINAIYDTGLASAGVSPTGQFDFADAYGVQASFGAIGTHSWQHTSLALDYRGDVRHYNRQTYYDGTDHTLSLNLAHQLSRRVTLELNQGAMSTQRAVYMSLGTPSNFYDSRFNGLTGDELFDNPTRGLFSTGRIIYQHTPRLSYSASGTGFLIRRRSTALFGAQGYYAVGDVAYRLSRYQTIGFDYNFSHFDITRQFGSTDVHGVSLDYAVRLTRNWELNARLGGYRAEVSRVQRVQVDPVIAAILGQTFGLETFNRVIYIPHLEGSLMRSFRRSTLSLHYSRMIMPGNGVFTTAGHEAGELAYSYRTSRRMGMQASVGYSGYSSLADTIGKYRSYHAGAGMN